MKIRIKDIEKSRLETLEQKMWDRVQYCLFPMSQKEVKQCQVL